MGRLAPLLLLAKEEARKSVDYITFFVFFAKKKHELVSGWKLSVSYTIENK